MSMHLAEIGRRVAPGAHAALVIDGAGYPYEVRDEKEYFDEIQDVKVTKDARSGETHRQPEGG